MTNLGQKKILAAVIERNQVLRMKVRGLSMSPLIRDGDVATITPMRGCPAEVGEVVAFSRNGDGKLTIHRVVAREKNGWRLRGDSCAGDNGVIPAARIIGRITGVDRQGRSIRFGIGPERRIIAWMVRSNWMRALMNGIRLPRRAAAWAVRTVQGFDPYRIVAGRLFGENVTVRETTREKQAWVRPFRDPNRPDFLEGEDTPVTMLIAERKGKIMGSVRLSNADDPGHPGGRFWLTSMFVRTRYRGLGIGEALGREAIRQSLSRGGEELLLMVDSENTRAFSLYRKLGFEPIILPELETQLKDEEQQYGRRRMVMRKTLNERTSAAQSA